MKCKFSHLEFNSLVIIQGYGLANCGTCGADVEHQLASHQAIYKGHSRELDMFELVNPFPCWSCGAIQDAYAEVCGGLEVTNLLTQKESVVRK